MSIIKNKYDFVAFIEVINGNPNGDPDTGNMPRIDPETGKGLITDVCIKRKIRNYVETVKGIAPGYDIYIKSGDPLNLKDKPILGEHGITITEKKDKEKSKSDSKIKKKDPDCLKQIRHSFCSKYYDIRTFGAVITSLVNHNGGQIRGPVQLGFARSIDQIFPHDITITRCVVTKEKDAEDKNNTFGSKAIVSYGLYRVEGYVSANLAKQTEFSEDDLELLWSAIFNMFEDDRSASRGLMSTRKLIIFKHDSVLGNCPSYKLFDAIKVSHKEEGTLARKYSDYVISIDKTEIPNSVEIIEK